MTVYVLTSEPYHDNSRVLAVYDTPEAAVDAGLAMERRPVGPSWDSIEAESFDVNEWEGDGASVTLLQAQVGRTDKTDRDEAIRTLKGESAA